MGRGGSGEVDEDAEGESVMDEAGKTQRPRTCETCAHRSGGMLYGKCMLSGFFVETERKFPMACGKDFEGWIQRESLLQRFKAWLYLS